MRFVWRVRCQFAGADSADRRRPQHPPLDHAGHQPRSHGGACRRRRLIDSVRMRRAFRRCAARPDAGVRCELPVRAGDQRSHHRRPAVFAVHHPAVAGAVAARERISVHRGRSDGSRPDLSRPVRADGTARRRSADDGLALHDLARRISASRARICAAQGCRWRRQDTYVDRQGDPRKHHRGRRCDFGADLGRHRQARHPADAAERRALYAAHDRRRVRGVVAQPGRACWCCGFGDRIPSSTSGSWW